MVTNGAWTGSREAVIARYDNGPLQRTSSRVTARAGHGPRQPSGS